MNNANYNVKNIEDVIEATVVNEEKVKVAKLKESVVQKLKNGWKKLKEKLRQNFTVAGLEEKLAETEKAYEMEIENQEQEATDYNKAIEIARTESAKEQFQENFENLQEKYTETVDDYQKDMRKLESQYKFVETAKDIKEGIKETAYNVADAALEFKDKSVDTARKVGESIVVGSQIVVGATIIGAEKIGEITYKTGVGIVNFSKDCRKKVESLQDKMKIVKENKYKLAIIKKLDKQLLKYEEEKEKLDNDIFNIKVERDKGLAKTETNIEMIRAGLKRVDEMVNNLSRKMTKKLDKLETNINDIETKKDIALNDIKTKYASIPEEKLEEARKFVTDMSGTEIGKDIEKIIKKHDDETIKNKDKTEKAIENVENKFDSTKIRQKEDAEIHKYYQKLNPMWSQKQKLADEEDSLEHEKQKISIQAARDIKGKKGKIKSIDNQIEKANELKNQLLGTITPIDNEEENKTK